MTDTIGSASSDNIPTTVIVLLCSITETPGSNISGSTKEAIDTYCSGPPEEDTKQWLSSIISSRLPMDTGVPRISSTRSRSAISFSAFGRNASWFAMNSRSMSRKSLIRLSLSSLSLHLTVGNTTGRRAETDGPLCFLFLPTLHYHTSYGMWRRALTQTPPIDAGMLGR
jgi:hypothetical protein